MVLQSPNAHFVIYGTEEITTILLFPGKYDYNPGVISYTKIISSDHQAESWSRAAFSPATLLAVSYTHSKQGKEKVPQSIKNAFIWLFGQMNAFFNHSWATIYYSWLTIFEQLLNTKCAKNVFRGFEVCRRCRLKNAKMFSFLSMCSGLDGAVRFLVVGIIGWEEKPPRGQLWMEQCLTSLKYWPI